MIYLIHPFLVCRKKDFFYKTNSNVSNIFIYVASTVLNISKAQQ